MAKVDLIDNSWVDLVFEGKNKEYGAHVLILFSPLLFCSLLMI